VISVDQDEVDVLSPPSAKRLKLSPRRNTPLSASIPCRLETPIVKRKTPRVCEQERKTPTPHSILKVKKLINHTPSKTDVQFEDDFKEFEKLEYTPVSKVGRLRCRSLFEHFVFRNPDWVSPLANRYPEHPPWSGLKG
jgi:hypothetical protein